MMRPITTMLAVGVALIATSALARLEPSYAEAVGQPRVFRVQTWQLLQSDGADLYEHMCASCHGAVGADRIPVARRGPAAAPPLTQLRAAGVPKQHWAYVIQSPSDDLHHRAYEGSVAMPCWRLIFREALGNDAAPMLVSLKLVDYLETIQK